MEYVLIHKPRGILSMDELKMVFDRSKQLMADPSAMVPGGKCTASYVAIGQQLIFCNWDVPNVESFSNMLQQMSLMGWDTEIIPVEKATVAIEKIEKIMQSMQKELVGSRS